MTDKDDGGSVDDLDSEGAHQRAPAQAGSDATHEEESASVASLSLDAPRQIACTCPTCAGSPTPVILTSLREFIERPYHISLEVPRPRPLPARSDKQMLSQFKDFISRHLRR